MSRLRRGILIFGILIVLLAMTVNIILLWHLSLHGKLPGSFTTLTRKSRNFWFSNVSNHDVWRGADEVETPENLDTTQLPVFDLYVDPIDIKALDSKLPKRKIDAIFNFPKYIPAKLEIGGHRYNIELRCRGNTWRHWYGPKKSLRLRFADNDRYLGIRLLNLNNPKYALPFLQTLAYQLATSIGILSPRSFLVHARLNNKYYGIMEAFEQPDKHFLQHKNRLVGDIYGEAKGIPGLWNKADPDVWKKHSTGDNVSKTDFANLKRLISVINEGDHEGFVQEITDVLEIDNFLKLYAMEQIISSYHTDIHNIRIYCDPRTKKFEFILWDPAPLVSYELETPLFDETSIDKARNILVKRILAAPIFRNRKNEILWDLVKDDHIYLTICRLADLYDSVSREDLLCDGNRRWDDDKYYRFPEKFYEETLNNFKKKVFARINKIRNDLQDLEVSAYFHEDNLFTLKEENFSRIFLSFRLKGKVGCKIDYLLIPSNLIKAGSGTSDRKISIAIKDKENIKKEICIEIDNESNMLQVPLDYILHPTLKEKHIEYCIYEIEPYPKTYYLEIELKDAVFDFYNIWQWLKRDNEALFFRNVTTDQVFSTSVKNFSTSDFVEGNLRNRAAIHKVSEKLFFSNSPRKEISWEGDVNLSQDTIIERDQVLYIKPGTEVRFAPEVSLVIKGQIIAQGTSDAPITFDKIKSDKNWGSVVVDESRFPNIFSHCIFKHGHMVKEKMYNGALYVYDSNVTIKNCGFYDNTGEDALNCQQSQVKILNCKFHRNASDAIDLDSCQGEIGASFFKDNKGDAIDLSDSQVLIKDNTILFSGDKGISIGENSFPEIIDNRISNNLIGIAVKDFSKAIIYKCTIINNQTGIDLYRKKAIFGGGKAMICSSIVRDNAQDFKCDKKSKLKILR